MAVLRNGLLRFAVEAVFLVLVAVAAGVEHLAWFWIIGVMGLAYLLVLGVERLVWALAAPALPAEPELEPMPVTAMEPEPRRVRVIRREKPVTAEPPVAVDPEPVAVPPIEEPAVEVPDVAVPVEEPVVAAPQLVAAASPPPEPPPPPAPSLAPGPPQRWNLWNLEHLVRAVRVEQWRDEELSFLLMYLREFAEADGALPVDFDGLVRESFGDLLAAGGAR